MKPIVVAVDLDGVIWDLLPNWLKLYNAAFDDDLKVEDIEDYDVGRYVKCDRASLMYLLEREEFWDSITIPKENIEALQELQDNDKVDLIIVTASNPRTSGYKFHRFRHLMPMIRDDQIVITARKDLIKADVLIDDWENNLKHMAKSKQGTPILVTHGYNKSFPNTQYQILRVNNLVEAVKVINDSLLNLK